MTSHAPPPAIKFTGERFIEALTETEIDLEHIHRYLMAAQLCDGAIVLDVASGSGYGSGLLATRAAKVYGVDLDAEAVAYAQGRYGAPNIEFKAGSVLDLPFEAATFDVIVSFETLEHLAEHEEMLAEFRRVLKPDGVLIISTPDKPIYNHFLTEPNPFHVRELTRDEFKALLLARFANTAFYGQRVAFGSVTLAEIGTAQGLQTIRRINQASFQLNDAFASSMYLIAVCSDGDLRPLPSGFYEGGIPQNALSALLDGISERDRWVIELREQVRLAGEAAQPQADAFDLQKQALEQEGSALRQQKRALEQESSALRQQIQTLEQQLQASEQERRVFEHEAQAQQAAHDALRADHEDLGRLAHASSRQLSITTRALKDVDELTSSFDPRFWGPLMQAGNAQATVGAVLSPAALREPVLRQLRATFTGFAKAARAAWTHRFNPRLFVGDVIVSARRCRLRPLRTVRMLQDIRLVRASGLIDADHYAPQKTLTEIPGFENARNYVLVGHRLDPNPLFSGNAYLRLNPDVEAEGVAPLAHFIRFGAAEGRPIEPPSNGSLAQQVDPEDRTVQDWVLQRDPGAVLTLHDRRPDDDVLAEGREGRDFLDRHDLLGQSPDFAGAVRELASIRPRATICSERDEPPKASIVVPVYGQLAYTLNCLHSLLRHPAHTSFEILIGDDASPDASAEFLPQLPQIRYIRHASNSGFVGNCNATATLARGDYVVMLNNDTRVVDGWLDSMIDSFGLLTSAGLIGSKLFYDDGLLQEAGGIFWRDGSAWNYGREDDPNRPRYCYARQVDYVSGASIAIPTALWRELGGFDEFYRPAYAEDADIAFRIRERGLRTWMQPLSRAIHYEGRTSGTDLNQGIKAHQVSNVKKLAERWSSTLIGFRPNGQAPELERDRTFVKRVLIIDATTPTPREDAGSVTTVTTMRLYQEMGYKVHFVPLHNFLYQKGLTDELHRMGVETAYYPYDRNLEEYLSRYGRYFDVVQVFRVEVAEGALQLLRRYAPQAPIIFHNIDMHYLRMERQAALSGDPVIAAAATAMKSRELALINAVDCTIVHSPIEQDILAVETPTASAVVFPYMIPLMGTNAGFGERLDVMFLGGYRHDPNVDAGEFLAKEVWPLIKPHLPEARLLLVGAHPPESLKALATEDIIVTGQVDDLRPYFDRSRVFAAGIRYGAGIKGKVATAMSYGVPVVATTVAAEGMYLLHDRDVRIADTPEQFAQEIVQLYTDPKTWARFSAEGLSFVAEKNSLAMGRRTLTEIIARASRNHGRWALEQSGAVLKGFLATEA